MHTLELPDTTSITAPAVSTTKDVAHSALTNIEVAARIHDLDLSALLPALPWAGRDDLHAIRADFLRWVLTAAPCALHSSWEEAWNTWTGASRTANGWVKYQTLHCRHCHPTHASRAVLRQRWPLPCACRGTRRGGTVIRSAGWLTAPASAT